MQYYSKIFCFNNLLAHVKISGEGEQLNNNQFVSYILAEKEN